MVATGAPLVEAVAELAAAVPDKTTLEAAHIEVVHRVHSRRSDDFTMSAILGLLLAALRVVPYEGLAPAGDKQPLGGRRSKR